jgi:drug/metabolite transporter (DMT)-like permease
MPRDRTLLIGTAAAVVAACLFATLGPLARFGAEAGVDGVAFMGWRALLGGLAILAGIALRGGLARSWRAISGLDGRGRSTLALAALMGLTLNVSIFTAFGRIPIGLALMLFYTYPAGVALADILLGRERPTPVRLSALAVATLGVALVLIGGLDLEAGVSLDLLGVLLGLAAAASQVVFMTISRTGYRTVPADTAIGIILAVSVIGSIPIAIVAGQGPDVLAPLVSIEPWPILIVAGVLAAGLSSFLFLSAIRRIGGTRTGILMLIEPVIGVALAGWWLGEALAPVQGVGGALVLAGAVILQLSSDPSYEPIAEESSSPLV